MTLYLLVSPGTKGSDYPAPYAAKTPVALKEYPS
jgi:hypothetical protein